MLKEHPSTLKVFEVLLMFLGILFMTRWWQVSNIFWNAHPSFCGEMIQFDLRIIFQMGWETTTNQFMMSILIKQHPLQNSRAFSPPGVDTPNLQPSTKSLEGDYTDYLKSRGFPLLAPTAATSSALPYDTW